MCGRVAREIELLGIGSRHSRPVALQVGEVLQVEVFWWLREQLEGRDVFWIHNKSMYTMANSGDSSYLLDDNDD